MKASPAKNVIQIINTYALRSKTAWDFIACVETHV